MATTPLRGSTSTGLLVLGAAWLATVGAAFWLGARSTDPGAPAPPAGGLERAGGEDRGPAPAEVVAEPRFEPAASVRNQPKPPPSPKPGGQAAGADAPLEPFTWEGVATPEDALARLLGRLALLLARGEAGHLEILRFLDEQVIDNDELEKILGSEEQGARIIYPLVKFLVNHETQVLDVAETVYATMAQSPESLAELDADTIEIFTEGLAFVLPGAVDEERLSVFREYARALVARPEEELPPSLRTARRRLERALALWAPPLAPEEALAALREGRLGPTEALALLRRLGPEQLAGLDLGRLLAPAIAAPDYRTVNELHRFPLTPRDLVPMDAALVEAAASGRLNPWFVSNYLANTGRGEWPAPRDLVERGLAAGGETANAFAQALGRLNAEARPPADYVRWVLDTYALSEATQKQLRAIFHLD